MNKSVPPSFCCFLGSCCCVSFAVVSSIWCAQTVQCVTTRTVFLFSIRQNNLPIADRQSVVVVGRWLKMGHPTEAPIAASYHIVCAPKKKTLGPGNCPCLPSAFPRKKIVVLSICDFHWRTAKHLLGASWRHDDGDIFANFSTHFRVLY